MSRLPGKLSLTLRPIRDHGAACRCEFHDAKRDPVGLNKTIQRFEGELGRRFRKLQGLVLRSLVDNDALGLKTTPAGMKDSAPAMQIRDDALAPGAFQFNRSSDKVAGFMRWLRQQERAGVLGVDEGTPLENAAERAWTSTYIRTSYQKGIKDAGQKLRREGADVASEWIEQAMSRAMHADRSGLAFTRVFSELEGITDTMDQQISRVLALGLAEGQNPLQIARNINNRIQKIGIVRARVLARTEVISAHAQATLNGFEEAGIEGVDVEAEWLTAVDPCPICEGLRDAGPYTINQARSLIPAHPNCRCAWAPKVVNGTGIVLK